MYSSENKVNFYFFFFFLLFFGVNLSLAQNYSVSTYQKINEINGGFNGLLNIDDSWGISIDNIGDLDGNGVNDLAVGAYSDNDGGFNRGAVWILFLDINDMVISFTKISDTSGGFNGILDDDDRFGGGVANLGDMNNDGLIELAVSADYDGDGGYWHGAIWILSLNANGTVNSHSKISDTEGGFDGFINGDAIFGTDVENIGDLNSDGVDDLAVGSRRDADGGSARGAVWILFMNPDFTVNTFQKISSTQGEFNEELDFEDYFGGSVLNIGDIDGDGVTDLVVGSYRDDDQLANSGSFYVLFLKSDGTVKDYQKVSNSDGGLTAQISSNAIFGESIDGFTDIDNDGKIEIIVGALRQNNPTLSVPTGAFFLIELNNDGTVSEEYLYTYGENCFSGELNSGDFFGGSVTVLKSGSNVSFAVGAYHDSENGLNKGAVWILNLGEISYTLSEVIAPTCQGSDGRIHITDLAPNSIFTVTFQKNENPVSLDLLSDSRGEIQITGLESGIYNNITITETSTGCSDNLGEAVLTSSTIDAQIFATDASSCDSLDGSISFSGLKQGVTYTIDYLLNSSLEKIEKTSSANGEIIIDGLASGIYEAITITETSTGCSIDLGQAIVEGTSLTLQIFTENPTNCEKMNGRIVIYDLIPNIEYHIMYTYNSIVNNLIQVSNSEGEIEINGLDSGIYTSLVISKDLSSCSNVTDSIELTCSSDDSTCFKEKKFFTPNNDGFNDLWSLEVKNNCDYTVHIYDRYGKLITVLNQNRPTWDGSFNGRKMPSDDYWYKVEYKIGTDDYKIFKSHFSLIR